MKSFTELFLEDIKFSIGKNQNWTARSGKNDHQVIFFSKDTKKAYQEYNQKTHGILSHSIKHYGEFNMPVYLQLAGEVKSTIRQFADEGKLDYVELYSQSGKSEQNPDKVFKQSKATDWLNALDAVQDIATQGGQLNAVEKVLLSYARRLGKLYETEIESRIRSAKNLDNIDDPKEVEKLLKGNKVVRFTALRDGRPITFYLDLQDNVVIIQRGATVATCFQFDTPASDYSGVIKNFYKKLMERKLRLDNQLLNNLFALIGQ